MSLPEAEYLVFEKELLDDLPPALKANLLLLSDCLKAKRMISGIIRERKYLVMEYPEEETHFFAVTNNAPNVKLGVSTITQIEDN